MATPDYHFPELDNLPAVNGQPQGCLWGFYDREGKKDEAGALNLLTPSVVQAASAEIKTGVRFQLDWPLENVGSFAGSSRSKMTQKVIDLAPSGVVGFDDEIHINTQASSQWDSLKHWGVQKSKLFYNGMTYEEAKNSTRNGIHNVCETGGIVGRAVLADWLRWWEHTHPGQEPPSPATAHAIPISEIEETLEYQGTTLRQGDIFLIRAGYVRWHKNADAEERFRATEPGSGIIGLDSNMETVRWLYSKHIAAVASDCVGLEAEPVQGDILLHDWVLAYWGTPIGELFDLEALSEECQKQGRFSFFFTSAPLNVKGGVASPPGAIAIF